MKLNKLKQTTFQLLCSLFFLTAVAQVQAQAVDYSIRLNMAGEYEVYYRPDFTLAGALGQISTSQVTIVAPTAVGALIGLMGEVPTNPLWGAVTNVTCQWQVNARVDAPPENPNFDYISVGMTPGCANPGWTAGVEVHMFSFVLGACDGALELFVNGVDPFDPVVIGGPNSANSNPGNEITILNFGNTNLWNSNYDVGMADCSATLLPDAIDDPDSTVEDVPVTTSVLTNDDQGDAPATVTGNTQGTNGSVSCTATDCTYTPNPAFVGVDTYTYTITDNDGDMDTATVTITVTDEGAPTAVDDVNSTGEDVAVGGAAFTNDSLIDDAVLDSFDPVSANGGTVAMNPDGTYTYTPATGFNGVDTFTYTICDDDTVAECSTATVTITVAAAGSPVAVDDSLTTTENVPITSCQLTSNDTLADSAVVISFDNPATSGGAVNVNADGTCTYTPPSPSFDGTDTFTYTICDNDIPPECDTATVTVTIADEGAPTAMDDSGFGLPNNDIMGSAFDNDSLVDDAILDSFDAVGTAGGTVVMNPDGTFTYTPLTDFLGTDTFTYTICDDDAVPQCSTATVTIRIAIPPTGPVPTLSQWGAILMALALLMLAYRRFNPPLRRMS